MLQTYPALESLKSVSEVIIKFQMSPVYLYLKMNVNIGIKVVWYSLYNCRIALVCLCSYFANTHWQINKCTKGIRGTVSI